MKPSRSRFGRPWWQRVAAVCLAAWFVVMTMDLPWLHACAMHGAPRSAAAAAAGHDQHAPAHGATHGATPDGSSDVPDGGHVCSCLGDCSGAVAAAPPPAAALAFRARLAPTAKPPGRPAHEYVAAWVDFVLPFATAPPPVRSA